MDRGHKSRVSSTPASSRSQSNKSKSFRTSELGIAEVSALSDLAISSSSSSSESDDEESEFYIPSSTLLLESHSDTLKNLRTRALAKVDTIVQDSYSSDFLEAINNEETKSRKAFEHTMDQLNDKMERLQQEDLSSAAELKELEAQLEEAKTMKHPSLGRAKQEFAKTTAQLGNVLQIVNNLKF